MTEQNATTTGDYLWTNSIVGEVFPTATTPSTWSVWEDYFSKLSLGDTPSIGIIAGRPYVNYSLTYSFLLKITRKHERVRGIIKDSVGLPPEGVEIPTFPISWRLILFQILPQEFRNNLIKGKLAKDAPGFLALVHDRCQELRYEIEQAGEDELIQLWTNQIRPLWNESHFLQDKQNEDLNFRITKLKKDLIGLVGNDEANELLTTISSAGELASLGPLVGLYKLTKHELSREEYLQRYGHRGPHENELAEPRSYEEPEQLDRQLAEFSKSPVDVTKLLAKRDAESAAILSKVQRKLSPKKAQAVEDAIEAVMEVNSVREATRSELTRLVGVIRAWFLRAGELAGIGDGVFFLAINEVIRLLSGDEAPVVNIQSRREMYEKYKALPQLPTWIRGRFDPFQWAADPNRRPDVYDPHATIISAAQRADNVIKGHPGSAGRVEGVVRRIDRPDEGDQLQPGEILVASTTNMGWTPLFPHARAVITDIGGSLSHAAIVARELGIPAVVGCGNATIRLHTGDRVRVDGMLGTVEILGNGSSKEA